MQAPGAIPALIAGVPYVCTYGYSYPAFTRASFGGSVVASVKRTLLRRSLSLVVSKAELVLITSAAVHDEARGLGAHRLRRLPNAVDTEVFAPADSLIDYDVVFVGQLVRRKGLSTLIPALAGLGLHLCVVGEGPERDAISRAAKRQGVSVTFRGRVANTDVASILQRSRIFVLPSFREGLPKALLEAMSCGLPCIVSDIPAFAELAAAEDALMLVPPGDVGALRACLQRLVSDSALRASLGASARKQVEQRFALWPMLRDEARLLAEAAGRTAAARGRES
jgi:glycosyltransferase involved in cell wall biosynthesis